MVIDRVVTVARDGFARADLQRGLISRGDRGECRWCGQVARFVYWWLGDGQRPWDVKELLRKFCSVGCWRLYES